MFAPCRSGCRSWCDERIRVIYSGEIPHAEVLRSVARRVSDGCLLGWVKRWLEMAVMEDDGKGCQRRTNRARKRTPQVAPIPPPLLSNVYMRRFTPGVEDLGPRPAVRRGNRQLRGRLRDLRAGTGGSDARAGGAGGVPRVPRRRNKNPRTGAACIGTRPRRGSVRRVCRKISTLMEARYGLLPAPEIENANIVLDCIPAGAFSA